MNQHEERIARRIALGVAVIALSMLCGYVLFGCGHSKHTRHTAGPWLAEYDAPWAAVTKCWKHEPAKPSVTTRPEPVAFVDPGGRLVHGYFSRPSTVVVAADRAALAHELSEYVCFRLHGHNCQNTAKGCFGVEGM